MPGRDAEATRQRLITAARAEFAEHGIAGARWDRIAAAANANKAQIYHYFGSKDRLFDAVWEAVVQQIIEADADRRRRSGELRDTDQRCLRRTPRHHSPDHLAEA